METIAQYLVGFLENHKGIGIQGHHQFLQFRNLLFFYSRQNHLGLLFAVATLTIEEGSTTVQLLSDLHRNGFIFLGERLLKSY